jgi:phospholipid/cholesterol/gamma-HCH transport system substrate-binding protein
MNPWKILTKNGSGRFSLNKKNQMENKSSMAWKLGLFATIGLALLIAGLFYLGQQKNLFGQTVRLRASFNNVGGLKEGNNVRLGGIDIGTVDGIRLINDTTVMVDMAVKGEAKKFIKKDATITISSEGLMGDKVLVILPGDPSSPVATQNDVLASEAPIETDDILSSLKSSAENAEKITNDLAEISHKLNKGHGVFARLIGDTALSNNLNTTVSNLKKGSQGLDENMEAVKHNFLLRGYFRKKQKEEEKKKNELEQAKNR